MNHARMEAPALTMSTATRASAQQDLRGPIVRTTSMNALRGKYIYISFDSVSE